ncbi:MAG: hypothetical protein BGO51_12290 [Rhodospirillales bacterium 69-11]|nr:MAG: hypothetical protein BGO51_12290 [Rhodospirillales bacterium 69-11]
MGPVIDAPHPWREDGARAKAAEVVDAQLAGIASIVRFRRGEFVCREGEPAVAMFSLASGAVSSWLHTPEQGQQVVGFQFANDLVGFARAGRYRTTVKAVTPLTAYRLPVEALERRLLRNPDLVFAIACKLSDDLYAAQDHAVLISRHRAVARLALFLQRLEARAGDERGGLREMFLPMSRTEIASYLNVSPEAVSRSFAELLRQGSIRVRERRYVMIMDHAALDALAVEPRAALEGEVGGGPPPGCDPDDAPCVL